MKNLKMSDSFLMGKEMEWETVGEGIKRKIFGYDDRIMMVNVLFEKGGIGTPHHHHHSQVTYVVEGKFEVTIDGVTKILEGGDSFFVPSNITHGAVCLESGLLVDVFSPMREDFL